MLKKNVNRWLSWSDEPYLKIYRGIGSTDKCFLHGHLFKGLSLQREKPSGKFFANATEMLKRFMVSPSPNEQLKVKIGDKVSTVTTDQNGYFFVSVPLKLSIGWHTCEAWYSTEEHETNSTGEVLVTDPKNIVISDIDDTILVSYSTSVLRKIYLLLSRNSEQRKPFEGIVESYKNVNRNDIPFVFVSSSEWNLYDFIIDFCEFNDFPKGIYYLQEIKKWRDLIRSGAGDHSHKKRKIEKLIELFPESRFHLVGDSGQRDPYIYKELALAFQKHIASIHLRDLNGKKAREIIRLFQQIPDSTKTELFKEVPDFNFIL